VPEQHPGVAEQVQRDAGEREVLLDGRRAGHPGAQPLAEDQRVVAEPQRVPGHIR